jgi:hypothetical protein
LPVENFDAADFVAWLEKNSLHDSQAQIAKINMVYDIDDFVAERKRFVKLRGQLEAATETGTCCSKPKAKLEELLKQSSVRLNDLQKSLTSEKRFLGMVFVTYQYER